MLEKAQLRRYFAIGKHLQRTLDEWNRLADICRTACAVLFPRSWFCVAAPHEVFVRDELVAVLLHHLARKLPSADDEHLLVAYCFSFSTSVMKSLSPPTMTNALM